ncbi:hydrogenase maturation protein, partial [Pseudomonadota bacterium]
MKVLLLSHSFNSLTQRFWVELERCGHTLSMELDINDQVTIEAVEQFQPDIIIAPYLKRAIPEIIWKHHRCIIIHPGIIGDRGPSALDWAILNNEEEWGVTALQADSEMDAGDVWAEARFPMRSTRKSSLYHNEITGAAVTTLHQVLKACTDTSFVPIPLNDNLSTITGKWMPPIRQQERLINWQQDSTQLALHKLQSADGYPGVLDELYGAPYYLFDAHAESKFKGFAGDVIAIRHNAICRATKDGAIWIGYLKSPGGIKLPATQLLAKHLDNIPEKLLPLDLGRIEETYQDIAYQENNGIGYLYFDFYNGAMSAERCERLHHAYEYARNRDTKIIALMGGDDFWSNGIDLNTIEAVEQFQPDINAMNDLCQSIITTTDKMVIAAMRGNAAAGGVFMALGADYIFARQGIILNPHYKNMGNLYGSEYWTYLL